MHHVKRKLCIGLTVTTLICLFFTACGSAPEGTKLQFRVTLTEEAVSQIEALGLETPIVGRVFAIISRDSDTEPRLATGVTGVPLWGMDVRDWTEGQVVTIADGKESMRGYPLATTAEIPPGDYYVQAFLNVYTTFHRADGHTIEAHLNSGAHQKPFRAPGNAFSSVLPLTITSGKKATIDLALDKVIQPDRPLQAGEVLQQGNYEDTDWVKYIKIKSDKVSAFWGRDMYIGANILLPKDYDSHPDVHYPVLYLQGHSSPWAPVPWSPKAWFIEGHVPSGGRVFNQLDGFYPAWTSGKLPKMIVITFRDSNPFNDTSYSINSPNVGPYGDAIIEELIPYLEKEFRIIAQPWARVLAGRSTGGWEAAAMMIRHPEFFAGSWPWAPDPVDFRRNEQINIYEDKNAYYHQSGWLKVDRPSQRSINGLIVHQLRHEFGYEQAVADKDRSGGQWGIWQAAYSAVGPDGYPLPLWDPKTGVIDPEVAAYWREHSDLSYILKRDWKTLGPKLRGKLHFAVGMMDNYYLNEAVYLVQEFLESTVDPPAEATFQYGFRSQHSWIGHSPVEPEREITYAEFIGVITDYITHHAPRGADTRSWKY